MRELLAGLSTPRIRDMAVVLFALALIVWPFVHRADASLSDSPVRVDLAVLEGGMISKPISGDFSSGTSGRSTGSVYWDVYTSADEGFKLSLASCRNPAFVDPDTGYEVPDFEATTPTTWSISGSERRFGFSAKGRYSLDAFDDGAKWRGFNGTTPIEVARRSTGPVAATRTEIRLRSDYGSPIPAGNDPEVCLKATASVNL